MYSLLTLSLVLPSALAAPQTLWPRHKHVSHAVSGNSTIDFSPWSLQLPIGDAGHPTTISSDQLQSGYSDPDKQYFYADGDVLVMKVPGSPDSTGCVTTPNSKHCRTELRESNPEKQWDPTAPTNVLGATLTVIKADDSKYGTVVGQIHIDDDISSKPVCELYYNQDGLIQMGVEKTRDGGNSQYQEVGNVPVGTEFSYEIHYENGELSVVIDGDETKLDQYELDNPESYFKAGNYNQGDSASEVHFTKISVEHSS